MEKYPDERIAAFGGAGGAIAAAGVGRRVLAAVMPRIATPSAVILASGIALLTVTALVGESKPLLFICTFLTKIFATIYF